MLPSDVQHEAVKLYHTRSQPFSFRPKVPSPHNLLPEVQHLFLGSKSKELKREDVC